MDFITVGQKAAICMNPPFRIQKKKKSAVAQFLNHAACILVPGELIICIAPQAIRKPIKKKCDLIHDTLHLEYESVLEAMQPFFDVKNNKTKRVRVVVQVWRVTKHHIERPMFHRQTQVPEFRLCCEPTPMPHFFIRIWTTIDKIGAVVRCDDSYSLKRDANSGYNKTKIYLRGEKIGTSLCKPPTTNSGTIVGVHVKDGVNTADVLARFERLYRTNYWKRYKQHTFSGSNNPQISKSEILLAYVDKLPFPRDPDEVVRV